MNDGREERTYRVAGAHEAVDVNDQGGALARSVGAVGLPLAGHGGRGDVCVVRGCGWCRCGDGDGVLW